MILFSQTAYLQHKENSSSHCLFFVVVASPMVIIYYFIESLASLSHTYGNFTDKHHWLSGCL